MGPFWTPPRRHSTTLTDTKLQLVQNTKNPLPLDGAEGYWRVAGAGDGCRWLLFGDSRGLDRHRYGDPAPFTDRMLRGRW